jgi:ribosomal protein S13
MDRLVIYLQNNGFGPGTAQYVVSRLGIDKTEALARVSENDLKSLTNMSDAYKQKLNRLIARSKESITNKETLMTLFGKLQELDREM